MRESGIGWACVLWLALGVVWALTPSPLGAQQAELRTFTIEPQPLASALLQFAEQSGLEVLFDARIAQGEMSPGVQGRYTPDQALRQLLAGSGLSYRYVSINTVTLERAAVGPDSGPPQLSPITVEGELEVDPSDLPFMTPDSSAYISRQQIDRVPPSAPGDIFRTVPGVFSAASNDGNSINVNIRGAQGLNRVRTMVEGTQQETTGNRGYAGSDQRSYVDTELIGGVEISKGPGSGPFSSGTTSGIVNVRLLDADDLVPEDSNYGLRIRGGVGSSRVRPTCSEDSESIDCGVRARGTDPEFRMSDGNFFTDDNWFGSIAGAYRSDRFELVLAYARREEGNYFAGNNGREAFQRRNGSGQLEERRFSVIGPGEEVPNTSDRTRSALFKGTLHFDGGHSLHAGVNYFDSQFGMAFPTNLTTFAPTQTRLNDVESKRGWLRYQWDSDNDLIDFQANLWGTKVDEQGEIRQAPQENESWGGEIWNTSIVDTGVGELAMVYGAEYSRSDGIIDLDVPAVSVTRAGLPVSSSDQTFPAFEGRREVFGSYFNAAYRPTHWLTLSAGVRYDRFKGENTTLRQQSETVVDPAFFAEQARLLAAFNAALPACLATGPDPSSPQCLLAIQLQTELNNLRQSDFTTRTVRSSTVQNESDPEQRFSPNFGVMVEPLNGFQVFGRYAEGFRALSLVELGQSFAFGTGFNPDLEPEVLKTWEFGVNYLDNDLFFANDILRSKVVYFRNNYDNFIGRPFEGAPFENYDDVSVSGIETTLSYDMGRVFADFNLSYYTELPDDIRTIASLEQPVYSGTLTAGTRWFDESLELGARATFFDDRRPELGDELGLVDGGRYWASNTIFDIFGSYRFNDHLSISFSVENLLDEYYLPPLFVNQMPAPGRTARISATIQF